MSTGSADAPRLQRRIPAVFMRGGTSKGVFFHARDLPTDREARDRVFLAVLGSPDPYRRQLDGMGGGVSSLSKAVIIGPPSRDDADLDYTFAQVAVDQARVDYGGTCGNLASAVGPFAYDEGLVVGGDGEIAVRIHATNTGKIILARFAVRGGAAVVEGDCEIAGVAGGGAPVRLEFLDPGGSRTGALLPTGSPADMLDLGRLGQVQASLVDAANPCVFVHASAIGLSGRELPSDLDANGPASAMLERIRAEAGVRMGFGASAEAVSADSQASPKVAIVAAPSDAPLLDGGRTPAAAMDIAVRMISMGNAHKAVPLTGALCLAVAARIPGSVVSALVAEDAARRDALRVGTASGVLPVAAEVTVENGRLEARHAAVYRTARRLMEGAVLVPERAFGRE
jgi:2-methylaconitate cis-trans-isomerase PrpF